MATMKKETLKRIFRGAYTFGDESTHVLMEHLPALSLAALDDNPEHLRQALNTYAIELEDNFKGFVFSVEQGNNFKQYLHYLRVMSTEVV